MNDPAEAALDRPHQPPWWQSAVIYQVYPRSFADADGDGTGDLRGVTERLDYLTGTLAVDAVWISPFYPSSGVDGGYDVTDHCAVEDVLGTLEDVDALIAGAHARGLRVIVDFIPAHTSARHPWFIEARSARSASRRDWYVWRDARADGAPPNNWLSHWGGPAWTWDEATAQFYLHSYIAD